MSAAERVRILAGADRATGRQSDRATGRPKLRVLNQQAERQRARRRQALAMLFLTVIVGFFAVAFVHAQLVAGQHDLDVLRAKIAEADAHRAELARATDEAAAPARIVSHATEELGMVRANQPVYLEAAVPQRTILVTAPLNSPLDRPVEQPTEVAAADREDQADVESSDSTDASDPSNVIADAQQVEIAPAPSPTTAAVVGDGSPSSSETPTSLGGVTAATSGGAAAPDTAVPTPPISAGASTGTTPSAAATSDSAAAPNSAAASQPVSAFAGSRAVSTGVPGAGASPTMASTSAAVGG